MKTQQEIIQQVSETKFLGKTLMYSDNRYGEIFAMIQNAATEPTVKFYVPKKVAYLRPASVLDNAGSFFDRFSDALHHIGIIASE